MRQYRPCGWNKTPELHFPSDILFNCTDATDVDVDVSDDESDEVDEVD